MDIEVSPRYIAFDSVEIDLIGRRLRVAGVETALEPKAFDVLALLVRSPGKAFTRDEILDAVWGHRHVTPSVLNRAVALIRQVLGADARNLHTLYGVGYRFDGLLRPPASPDIALAHAATVTSADAVETATTHVDTAVDLAPASSPAGPLPMSELAAAPAPPVPPRSHATRSRWLSVAALGLLAILALVWLQRLREPAPAATATLVVLPLHAIGNDKNLATIAEGLSEELTTQLTHIQGLRVISSTSATRAQKDGFDAAQLADRLHATHALEGSLRQAGDQLRVEVRLIETASGSSLWAEHFDRKPSEVLATQQDITVAVASTLALRLRLLKSTPTAPDSETYTEYLRLRRIFSNSNDDPPWEQATRDLYALIDRAPNFAEPHGLLALNLASESEGEGKDDIAQREAQRAFALDPDNADAHAALAEIEFRTRNWVVAEKELQAALAARPSDVILNMITGMWLTRLGYGDRAITYFRTAYASDPLAYWPNYNLGTELDILGHHDEAKPYLDVLSELDSTPEPSSFTLSARWFNAIRRHDLTAAAQFAATMPDHDGLRKAYVAVTAALSDATQWPIAEAAVAARERQVGDPLLTRPLLPHFQAATLLASLEPGNQEAFGRMVWSPEFAPVRRDPAFQDFIKRMKFIDFWNLRGWPPQCRPEGDGAHCD